MKQPLHCAPRGAISFKAQPEETFRFWIPIEIHRLPLKRVLRIEISLTADRSLQFGVKRRPWSGR